MINATASGALINKTLKVAYGLLDQPKIETHIEEQDYDMAKSSEVESMEGWARPYMKEYEDEVDSHLSKPRHIQESNIIQFFANFLKDL